MENKRNKYFRAVGKRIIRYAWLFLFLFSILMFNQYRIMPYAGEEWAKITPIYILDSASWALVGVIIVAFIPVRWLRKVLVGLQIGVYLLCYFTDCYLINTYSYPFSESLAMPLFGTNKREATEFLQTMGQPLLQLWTDALWILLLLAVSITLPLIVTRIAKAITKQCNKQPIHIKTRPINPNTAFIGLSIIVIMLAVVHIAWITKAYKQNKYLYGGITTPERIVVSNMALKREKTRSAQGVQFIEASSLNTALPQQSFPQHIIVLYLPLIDLHYMHCYNTPYTTTPKLDKLIDTGDIIRYDSVYNNTVDQYETLLARLSLPTNTVNTRIALSSILSKAHYKSLWLSNYPKYDYWQKHHVSLANQCDSSFYTNLRTGWANFTTYGFGKDEMLVEHFPRAINTANKTFTMVHFEGAAANLWEQSYTKAYTYNEVKEDSLVNVSKIDEFAQYLNVIYSEDDRINRIIENVKNEPVLMFIMGDVGLRWNGDGYLMVNYSQQELHRIPFLVYISPKMKAIAPNLYVTLQKLQTQPIQAEHFPQLLLKIIDVKQS